MPHLTLEYSSNLSTDEHIDLLCRKLAICLDEQTENGIRVFPRGGIRVRAVACSHYCIADGSLDDAAFAHGILKMAVGRSQATRAATGDAVFAVMKAHFAEQFEKRGLALSLEINEFGEAGTWKHNNLHARFKR